MAKNRSLRRNHIYEAISAHLEQEGYRFEPVESAPHPYVLIDTPFGAIRYHFPGTSCNRRAPKNAVCALKRALRELREPMPRKFDKFPICCGICRRDAEGLGYAPRSGKPVMWLCRQCLKLGKRAFHMPHEMFNLFERESLLDAGSVAGSYLESIGKFSLDELSPDEWETFLQTILASFGDEMRKRILNLDAPF